LEAHVRYYTQVGFISKNKEEKLRQIMLTRIRKAQHYNNPRFGVYIKARKNNALSFLREARVINKEILDYDDYVYDITLEWEEFPYYFANGILTHNSLYPTLMTRMNLSGETVNCTCCPDSANRVPELEFNICERSAGIVPLSLKILLDKRARYKAAKKTVVDKELKTLYDRGQAALKWILVCSFGYHGFKNPRCGKIDSKVGVLNRYYGIFEDGTLKVRGIDVRRHDTPDIVRQCQTKMLDILTKARDSNEFRLLVPQALKVLEKDVGSLRDGSVPLEDLVIVRNLSKNPDEYTHQVPHTIAARHLVAQGGSVHAGQQVSYILTSDRTRTAVPPEVVDEDTVYDAERYVDLLCSSTANLLLPLGYDAKYLRTMFKRTEMKRPTAPQELSITAPIPWEDHFR